jgi:hypothetical protein
VFESDSNANTIDGGGLNEVKTYINVVEVPRDVVIANVAQHIIAKCHHFSDIRDILPNVHNGGRVQLALEVIKH